MVSTQLSQVQMAERLERCMAMVVEELTEMQDIWTVVLAVHLVRWVMAATAAMVFMESMVPKVLMALMD